MLLADFFRDVYHPLRLLGRSHRTTELYAYSIRLFEDFLGREAQIADLTDLNVSRHLARLLAQGRRPAGVNKERDQLLALWRLAARKRLIDQFPEVRRVHEPEVLPVAWSFEEMWRLRISCNYVPGEYSGIPARLWWLAMHELLWATGERIAAVMLSKWSDFSGNVIIFPADSRKGRSKANVCHLPENAVSAIEAIRAPARERIFAWPFSESYIYRVYHTILERAELDTSSRSKFHRMRRSHATHLRAAGGDPQLSLGHSNPSVTARYIDERFLPKPSAGLLGEFGKPRNAEPK